MDTSHSTYKSFILRALERMPQNLIKEVADFIAFKTLQRPSYIQEVEKATNSTSILLQLSQSSSETLDVETLAKQQNYKPVSAKSWEQIANEVHIEESLDHLLGQLTS